MDEPTLINNIDRLDRLQSLIRHDMRDLGIKLPKLKKVKKQNQRRSLSLSMQNSQEGVIGNKIFGQHLSQIPCVNLPSFGYVPQFLINTAGFVKNHSESEGIFRKSGSVGRQKELRAAIEDGKPLDEANINDVTSLIKQFFRELPEPLILPIYLDAFIKGFQLPVEKDQTEAVLRMCLLLPVKHVGCLRYMMDLLHQVTLHSHINKMHAANLALVIAPNLIGGGGKAGGPQHKMSAAEEKALVAQTGIVELLIKHYDQVGMVGGMLRHQMNLMSECFGTDDDLDASDDNTLEDSKDVSHKKKRRRSGSLTGIVSSIAQGIAKLRRSTDGKSVNMSSNSTFRGELSLASDTSELSHLASDATPHIMRKRRASGDTSAFTSSKKQAILGTLPQRSALASTPFTPSSTLKREQNPHKGGPSQDHRLNATTPIMGTKTSRKKLNLFTSPGSNKKVKSLLSAFLPRQNSVSGHLESPPAKTGKGKIFRKKSGNRDKGCRDYSTFGSDNALDRLPPKPNASPKSAVSDSVLYEPAGRSKRLPSTASASSFQDGSESSLVVVDEDIVFCQEEQSSQDSQSDSEGIVVMKDETKLPGPRSKSVDSPGITRGQPNALINGLGQNGPLRGRGKLDKSLISKPSPLVVPVVTGAVELRRSRRDDFELQQRRLRKSARDRIVSSGTEETIGSSDEERTFEKPDDGACIPSPAYDLDKSAASQLDSSLMGAVLPPPHGFEDQTMLEEEEGLKKEDCQHGLHHYEEEIDVDSDCHSEAGFSTISGGTVMHRTESGRYARQDHHSLSGSSLISSVSLQDSRHPLSTPAALKQQGSTETEKDESCKYEEVTSTDSGKITPPEDQLEEENPYVILRANANTRRDVAVEGEYVMLRQSKHGSAATAESQSSKGMRMLCENYQSSGEDSSSSSNLTSTKPDLDVTIGSHQDDLDNMPRETDVTRGKSLSAEDLQRHAKVSPTPTRAHSMYVSPCRRFNYKPHLEIRRETHTILARAGYMPSSAATHKWRDVQVPVKSPPRSSYREEMKLALRSSFYERKSRLDASLRSYRNRSRMEDNSLDSKTSSAANTSISSDYEKLSISSHDNLKAASVDASSVTSINNSKQVEPVISELLEKVEQISAGLETSKNQEVSSASKDLECNEDSKCFKNTQNTKTEAEILPEAHVDADFNSAEAGITKTGVEDKLSVSLDNNTKPLKECDKSLTLSGILDKELANQIQIKRAEMLLPKHDSIVDVQQAGIVAQSVLHFSQHHSKNQADRPHGSLAQRKGSQTIRIPTIFAKSDHKVRHYKTANFVRERSGTEGFMSFPETPTTPKANIDPVGYCEDEEGSELSESDEENVTVLEVSGTKDENMSHAMVQINRTSSTNSSSIFLASPQKEDPSVDFLSSPKQKIRADTSESQLEQQGMKMVKSPLLESTNTAATSVLPRPNFDLSEALALCAPSSEMTSTLNSCPKPRPHTPHAATRAFSRSQHLKRLKATNAARKQTLPAEDESLSTGALSSDEAKEGGIQEQHKLSTLSVTADNGDTHV